MSYRRKRHQIGNLSSEEKKMIPTSLWLQTYIERAKSRHQCSETFIIVFVFFTPHIHWRISVFSRFCVTLVKVCARVPWFAAAATLVRTISWKIAGAIIIATLFQKMSKFPLPFVAFSFLALFRKFFISFIPTVRQTKDECYGTEKLWY